MSSSSLLEEMAEQGQVETVELNKLQRITAQVVARNWSAIPQVTHHDEIDVTQLERVRRLINESVHDGPRVTLLHFVIAALPAVISELPHFNAGYDADAGVMIYRRYLNVGIAIDTPNGLLIGVIREPRGKPVSMVAQEVAELGDRARTKGLPLRDMVGAGLSISSLGHIGGTAFTPLINGPEVAMLGLSRTLERPRRIAGDQMDWRQMLPISLSYDHRVINGAEAARFAISLEASLGAVARSEEEMLAGAKG